MRGKAAKVAKAGMVSAMEASRGAGVLQQLYDLAACEADEPDQLEQLDAAIVAVSKWLEMERAEIGQAEEPGEGLMGAVSPMKAWQAEMKAEPMTTGQLDKWLAGKISRRINVVPFGGPLPGGKAGLDLDGEYFDEETDLYGPYPSLRRTRERLVDWHHDGDPTGVMKGAILGRIVLDAEPEGDGYWADFWANAGERRRNLMAQLEQRGIPLFGSSQAEPRAVRKADDGHLLVWPLIRHTITTSPQNTYAVVPPIKALLSGSAASGALTVDALSAYMVGADTGTFATLDTFPGNGAGNGGLSARQRQRLNGALDELAHYIRSIAG